jgi:SRSO17 transposase
MDDESGRPWRRSFDPERWGLDEGAIDQLGADLYNFWERYRECFATKTRDRGELALMHMRGQLTMDGRRNFAHIDERLAGSDGQSMQHFMSNSPWQSNDIFEQLRHEICETPGVQTGSVIILDESADEKAGDQSAGAGRQHNGRLGKIGLCQVATCLGYANMNLGLWTLLDGELFLPESWFQEDHAALRHELGIPETREFATKPELGLKMIARALEAGVSFERVVCDELYGRGNAFRKTLDSWGLRYAAQVPSTTYVYLSEPRVAVPKRHRKSRRPPTTLS